MGRQRPKENANTNVTCKPGFKTVQEFCLQLSLHDVMHHILFSKMFPLTLLLFLLQFLLKNFGQR